MGGGAGGTSCHQGEGVSRNMKATPAQLQRKAWRPAARLWRGAGYGGRHGGQQGGGYAMPAGESSHDYYSIVVVAAAVVVLSQPGVLFRGGGSHAA